MVGRYVAPAGAPIGAGDLVRWCRRWGRLSEAGEELRRSICSWLGRRHCHLVSTGRAGLTLLLVALKSLASPERDQVILPSYTCYSVPASAVRAGLRLRIVDIDPASLDFNLESLGNTDFRRVLAIVPTSLYGLPGRLADLANIARDNGVFLVDDAAQSLGAALEGRPAGGWGDAGLLSFDKGKAVSAIDGGAIVTGSDAIAEAVALGLRSLRRPGIAGALGHAVKLGAYVTCLHPTMYWLPNSVPGLGLGRTEYRPGFALERESRWLAALGATMWPRLVAFTSARVANAARYRAGLPDTAQLSNVAPVVGARPSYLRFPVLVKDASLRSRLLFELTSAGIGATGSYPGSIADIPQVQPHLAGQAGARIGRFVARSIVTLPTHPYVAGRDLDRAVGIVRAAVGDCW